MIQVDGSLMEGGGQLLRMATTYSAILSKPVTVYNIRANRRDPGLKTQHLKTLQTAAEITDAELTGAELGSDEISFKPRRIHGGEYFVDICTAGSISLLLQCINPILWYADKQTRITVRGGTAVNWSPSVPFLEHVVYEAFRAMGANALIEVERHGFYPKGGGEVHQYIQPVNKLTPLVLEKPVVKMVNGLSLCGSLPEHVATRQAASAKKNLNELRANLNIRPVVAGHTASPGSFVVLWCEGLRVYLGADSLGARGKPSEVVGKEAATKLISAIRSGANLDKHTTDHMILPVSLADGESFFRTSEITLHTLTAIKIAEAFTDAEFKVDGVEGKPGLIRVKGIGYRRG